MNDTGPLSILAIAAAVLLGVVGWRAATWPPDELEAWGPLLGTEEGVRILGEDGRELTPKEIRRLLDAAEAEGDFDEEQDEDDGWGDDEPLGEDDGFDADVEHTRPDTPPQPAPKAAAPDPVEVDAAAYGRPPIAAPDGTEWTAVAFCQEWLLGKIYFYDPMVWPKRVDGVEVDLQYDAQPRRIWVAWRGTGDARECAALMLVYSAATPDAVADRGSVSVTKGWIGVAGQYLLRIRHDGQRWMELREAGVREFVQPSDHDAFDVRARTADAPAQWAVREHTSDGRVVAVVATPR